jgi:hypothetical protein
MADRPLPAGLWLEKERRAVVGLWDWKLEGFLKVLLGQPALFSSESPAQTQASKALHRPVALRILGERM